MVTGNLSEAGITRMLIFSCFCFLSTSFAALAEDGQACSELLDVEDATQEGLEMLQAKAGKLTSSKELAKTSTVQVAKRYSSSERDPEFERLATQMFKGNRVSEEPTTEKIRFRARHKGWIDILDFYKDGFLQRYHTHDAGVWQVNAKNQLVLKWLHWNETALQSADGGKSFEANGQDKMTIKSFAQPAWWLARFNDNDKAHSQDLALVNTKAIIRAHMGGSKADLDEKGYRTVVSLKDNSEMEKYIRRVVDSLKMTVLNAGKLAGMTSYYSGVKTSQSLHKMKTELMGIAWGPHEGRWVMDRVDGSDATLDEEGYRAVALLKNNAEMEKYIRRVAEESLHATIVNVDGLKALVPYYSGIWSRQSFASMTEDLKEAAQESGDARWLLQRTDGTKANLDEVGYAAVAKLKNNAEMEKYMRRVVESLDLRVINEGGLKGILPYYSGVKTWQSLQKLRQELKETSVKSKELRWVMDKKWSMEQSRLAPGMSLLQEQTNESDAEVSGEEEQEDAEGQEEEAEGEEEEDNVEEQGELQGDSEEHEEKDVNQNVSLAQAEQTVEFAGEVQADEEEDVQEEEDAEDDEEEVEEEQMEETTIQEHEANATENGNETQHEGEGNVEDYEEEEVEEEEEQEGEYEEEQEEEEDMGEHEANATENVNATEHDEEAYVEDHEGQAEDEEEEEDNGEHEANASQSVVETQHDEEEYAEEDEEEAEDAEEEAGETEEQDEEEEDAGDHEEVRTEQRKGGSREEAIMEIEEEIKKAEEAVKKHEAKLGTRAMELAEKGNAQEEKHSQEEENTGDHTDEGLLASLLAGDDDTEASNSQIVWPPQTGNGSRIHIMGHFHTGTNLLQELMRVNFEDVEVRAGTSADRVARGHNHWAAPCDFWKHASLSFMKSHQPEAIDSCSSLHVMGVAMIRNPLSWLSSFKRYAYDLEACNKGEDWLRRPCSYPLCSAKIKFEPSCKDSYHRKMAGVNYSSVADIWNSWTRDYERINEFGFPKSILVRYEDLILEEEKTMAKIAEVVGTDMPSNFQHVEEGISPWKFNVTDARSLAMEKIKTKSYLENLTKQELQDACSRLDQQLMLRHGYDDCQNVNDAGGRDAPEETHSREGINIQDLKWETVEEHKEEKAIQGHEEKVNEVQEESQEADLDKERLEKELLEEERTLLQESDVEKIRFRARHKDWIDIIDLYKDGFFARYHDHDAGIWHVNKDKNIVLKWLRWGEEELQSTDGGRSFNASGTGKFTLKSFVQPDWWRKHFQRSDGALLQELAQQTRKSKTDQHTDMEDRKEIIRAHMNGGVAPLDDSGYVAVAMLKDDSEMKTYIQRVVESMNLEVASEGGLNGMVPYYSGMKTWQTLGKMKTEIRDAAKRSGWVIDRTGQDPNLALLQRDATRTSPPGQEEHTEKDIRDHYQSKVSDASSKDSSKDAQLHRKQQEIDFERQLLEESDIEKIRFRARHDDWIDILDLYKDGFFKRYHDRDVGVWQRNGKDQLVLKWLQWGEEDLQSVDGGRSFSKAGKGNFSLKSYVQPVWWRKTFDGSDEARLQEQSKSSAKSKIGKSHTLDMKAIITAHVNGGNADLDEVGYKFVAMLKSNDEMKTFIRRLAKSMHMVVNDEGGLNGIVPYYSGEITYQTLVKLREELTQTARKPIEGVRWVMDQGGEDPTHAF